jgi:anti-anti-sigma regulatory factor
VQISEYKSQIASDEGLISLRGVIDITSVSHLYQQLQIPVDLGGEWRIDASDIEGMDGAGAQLLLAFTQEMTRNHSPVTWVAIAPVMRTVVEQLGLDELGAALDGAEAT